jgi:hypothetical protein
MSAAGRFDHEKRAMKAGRLVEARRLTRTDQVTASAFFRDRPSSVTALTAMLASALCRSRLQRGFLAIIGPS